MGYWKKIYEDGGQLVGDDHSVEKGLVSWSKTSLDKISGVVLGHDPIELSIYGNGDFWQSDTFEIGFFHSESVLKLRRIEKLVLPTDMFMSITSNDKLFSVVFNKSIPGYKSFITSAYSNKWLIVEYSIPNSKARWYISDRRI